jgi:DNA-binding MarR family transcriptional regulator
VRPDASQVFRAFVDAVGLYGQAAAAAAGVAPTEWYALGVLDLAGGLTAGELAERTGLTTGATTRLIDRLERRGRVRRVADPGDRRRVRVEPVPWRPGHLDDVVGPARRTVAEVLDRYDPDQLAVLFDFFERAAPAFRDATEILRKSAPPRA